jgi:hypothetical protein
MEALSQVAEIPEQGTAAGYGLLPWLPEVRVNQGSLTEAKELLSLLARYKTSDLLNRL